MNSIQRAQQFGQSVWLNYIRRGVIKSSELRQLAESGIIGLTVNPTILEKAMISNTDYDDELITLARVGSAARRVKVRSRIRSGAMPCESR